MMLALKNFKDNGGGYGPRFDNIIEFCQKLTLKLRDEIFSPSGNSKASSTVSTIPFF